MDGSCKNAPKSLFKSFIYLVLTAFWLASHNTNTMQTPAPGKPKTLCLTSPSQSSINRDDDLDSIMGQFGSLQISKPKEPTQLCPELEKTAPQKTTSTHNTLPSLNVNQTNPHVYASTRTVSEPLPNTPGQSITNAPSTTLTKTTTTTVASTTSTTTATRTAQQETNTKTTQSTTISQQTSTPPVQHPYVPLMVCVSPGIKNIILQLIAQETEGIIGACYLFDSLDLAKAWTQKKNQIQGFKSLLFLDNKHLKNTNNALNHLEVNEIPLVFHRQRGTTTTNPYNSQEFFESMHHKFFAFLGQNLLLTASYNWTNAAEYNEENAQVIFDPHCIEDYFKELHRLYAYRHQEIPLETTHLSQLLAVPQARLNKLKELHPQQEVFVYFTNHLPPEVPCEIINVLESLIGNEQEGIYAVENYFTLYNLAEKWVARKDLININNKTSLDSRLVIDKEYCKNSCSALNYLIQNNIPVFAYTGNNILHNKFMIFRSNSNGKACVVAGSLNKTGSSVYNNWENLTLAWDVVAINFYINKYNTIAQRTRRLATIHSTKSISDYVAKSNRIPLSKRF